METTDAVDLNSGFENDVHKSLGHARGKIEVAGEAYANRTIFNVLGISPEEFKAVLEAQGSVMRAAKALGIHRNACARWAKRLGFTPIGHRPRQQPNFSAQSDWGAAATWFKLHPGQHLPTNLREAALEAGVSYASLVNYVARRKQKGLKFLMALGSLNPLEKSVTAQNGMRVPLRRITSYTLDLEPRLLVVTVKANLGALGKVTLQMPMRDYVRLFKEKA